MGRPTSSAIKQKKSNVKSKIKKPSKFKKGDLVSARDNDGNINAEIWGGIIKSIANNIATVEYADGSVTHVDITEPKQITKMTEDEKIEYLNDIGDESEENIDDNIGDNTVVEENYVTDELDNMDRTELKRFIVKNKLAKEKIRVLTSDIDDEIRDKIRATNFWKEYSQEGNEGEVEDEPEIDNKPKASKRVGNNKRKIVENDDDDFEDDDWFASGDSLDETKFKQIDLSSTRSTNKYERIWLKPDSETTVTILNKKPGTLWEHNIKIDGVWGNFFTCLEGTKEKCPMCEAGNKPKPVKVFNVIEHTEYDSKEGHIVNPEKILAMPPNAYKLLKKYVAKYFGSDDFDWQGLNILLMRSDAEKAFNIGDGYIVQGDDEGEFSEFYSDDNKELKEKFRPKKRADLIPLLRFRDSEED